MGGAIAGGAGAVVLSRKGTKDIKSKLIVHDKRKIKMKYLQDSGDTEFIYFAFTDFNVFEKLIPEKNYDLIRSGKPVNTAEHFAASGTVSVSDRLRELAKIKDEGILSEEEYEKKKSELLKEF